MQHFHFKNMFAGTHTQFYLKSQCNGKCVTFDRYASTQNFITSTVPAEKKKRPCVNG